MVRKLLLIILISFFLAACNLPKQTNSLTPTPDATLSVTKTASSTPTAAATLTPTFVATESAKIYFDGDTNCRTGPGVRFTLVTKIKQGQIAELLGQSDASAGSTLYWVVKNPNGTGPCWVVRDFATPQGKPDKLSVATAPATFTPMPTPAAAILADWHFSCEYTSANDTSTSTITVELKWHDMSDYELGYDIYRNDEMIASLPPNTTSYTDVTYLSSGQGVTYVIEAWNNDGAERSKNAIAQCQ